MVSDEGAREGAAVTGGLCRWPPPRPGLRAVGMSVPGAAPAGAALGHGMQLGRFLSRFKTTPGVCYKY